MNIISGLRFMQEGVDDHARTLFIKCGTTEMWYKTSCEEKGDSLVLRLSLLRKRVS